MMLCSIVVECHHFRRRRQQGPVNVGILCQHYMASQPRRPQLVSGTDFINLTLHLQLCCVMAMCVYFCLPYCGIKKKTNSLTLIFS
jgi:hypothetical protein